MKTEQYFRELAKQKAVVNFNEGEKNNGYMQFKQEDLWLAYEISYMNSELAKHIDRYEEVINEGVKT